MGPKERKSDGRALGPIWDNFQVGRMQVTCGHYARHTLFQGEDKMCFHFLKGEVNSLIWSSVFLESWWDDEGGDILIYIRFYVPNT